MEKRIGIVGIVVEDKQNVSEHSELTLGRMGLPRRDSVNVIALIIEGSNEDVGALTGKLGNLKGIKVRSTLTNYIVREE